MKSFSFLRSSKPTVNTKLELDLNLVKAASQASCAYFNVQKSFLKMMQSVKQGSVGALSKVGGKIKFPDKFKGTIVEKWADYWKNLFIDYRQMLQDLRTDIQDDPYKTMKWITILGASFALAKNNPNELDFKDELKTIENKAAMVGDDCLNKESVEHLRFLQMSYNAGLIHYRSLGIFSIMYMSELNQSCDLYKAHCSYIKPSYFSYLSRIVDVGIVGNWWNLYRKTTNYDVNFNAENQHALLHS